MLQMEKEELELLEKRRKAKTPEEKAYWDKKVKEYWKTHDNHIEYGKNVICFV